MSKNGRPGQACREDGCDASLDVYQCRGYCLRHYRIHRLAGDFGHRPCTVEGCDRHAVGSGLCELHRNRIKRTGRPDVSTEPKVGANASSWRGGRTFTEQGYILVTLPPDHPQHSWARPVSISSGSVSRQILEHRLVMGIELGRPLRPHESVHHVNGNRADNRLENLQLRFGAHGPGVHLKCQDCGSVNVEAMAL